MIDNDDLEQDKLDVSVDWTDWDGNGRVTLTHEIKGTYGTQSERITLDVRDAVRILAQAAEEVREKCAEYGWNR